VLKRLVTAGVLTAAAGGVLMTATPAMAFAAHGHHDYDSDGYKNRHNALVNGCEINAGNDRTLISINILQDLALLSSNSANDVNVAECDQENFIVNRNR